MPRKTKRRTRKKRGGTGFLINEKEKMEIFRRMEEGTLTDDDKKHLYCSMNDRVNEVVDGPDSKYKVIDGVVLKNSPYRSGTNSLDEANCNNFFKTWADAKKYDADLVENIDLMIKDAKEEFPDVTVEELFGESDPHSSKVKWDIGPGAPDDIDYDGGRKRRRKKSRKKRRKSKKRKSRRKRKRSRRRRRRR